MLKAIAFPLRSVIPVTFVSLHIIISILKTFSRDVVAAGKLDT
jgi:hypothetical protein